MKTKNFFLRGLFFYFLLGSLCAIEPNNNLLDGVVAVVNGELILASDVKYEVRKRAIQENSNPSEQFIRNYPRTALLDKMINELVLEQRAKNLQIYIDPIIVQSVMKNIANRGGVNLGQLRKELERQGLNFYRFKKGIEKELIFTRLREVEVESQLRVSEYEVDLFLEFHTNNNLSADEVLISQYKVSFEKDTNKKEKNNRKRYATEKREVLNKKFKNKDSFNEQILDGFVSMGWRSYDRLPKIFVKKLQGLQKGAISEVIESQSGFHILHLNDRRSSVLEKKVPTFKARHILLKVNSQKNENQVQRRAYELHNLLIAGDSFSDLAANYSEDIASAEKGGELGWAYPGDYVEEFEKAMLKLKPGEISKPVRSTYGYHIIELIDRREELLSPERQRTMAKLILRKNKLKETTDEWVRELRANSYVDIKIKKSRL